VLYTQKDATHILVETSVRDLMCIRQVSLSADRPVHAHTNSQCQVTVLHGLIFIVIVNLVVPEESLVTVSPEEVLRSDILIWIFNTLL